MYDVYQRQAPPQHWPADVRAWAERVMQDGRPVYSGGPLTDEQALDLWLPLPSVSLAGEIEGEREAVPREEFAAGLGVILLWPDGSLHMGVPPREPGDLLHLYRVARLVLDAYAAQGRDEVIQAFGNSKPPQPGAAVH